MESHIQQFPAPGFHFHPTDEELVVHYLAKKVAGQPLPGPACYKIFDVDIYKWHPDSLAEMYKKPEETMLYFFSPRERKYKNGSRPSRTASNGFWKATGSDKSVISDGRTVAFKKVLTYFECGVSNQGSHDRTKAVKTSWIMHEFRLNQPPRPKSNSDDMRLDDILLYRIYNRKDRLQRSRAPRNTTTKNTNHESRSMTNHVNVPEVGPNRDATFSEPPQAVTMEMMPLQYCDLSLPPPLPSQYPNHIFHSTTETQNIYDVFSYTNHAQYVPEPDPNRDVTFIEPPQTMAMTTPLLSQYPNDIFNSTPETQNLSDVFNSTSEIQTDQVHVPHVAPNMDVTFSEPPQVAPVDLMPSQHNDFPSPPPLPSQYVDDIFNFSPESQNINDIFDYAPNDSDVFPFYP